MKKFDITSAPLEGRSVIEASAGTGKTYAIAGLFLRLVVEANLKINQILVVTFTVAATDELRDRIRRRLREGLNALTYGYTGSDSVLLWLVGKYHNNKNAHNRLKEAIVCFDEAAIFTIHGFCQKLLSENAFESSTLFDTELLLDDSDILLEVCRDYYRCHFLKMYPFLFSNPQVKKITPDSLLKLIKYLSVDPEFTIIPKHIDLNKYLDTDINLTIKDTTINIEANNLDADTDTTINDTTIDVEDNKNPIISVSRKLQSFHSSIKKIWQEEREQIIKIILTAQDNNVFNAKSIKENTYLDVFNAVDIYVQTENFWNIEHDKSKVRYIEKLTDRFMLTKAKKNTVQLLPNHPFFKKVEDFISLIDKTQNMVNSFCLNLKLDFLKYADDALKKSKTARNVRAFDDLLVAMHKAVGNGNTPMADAVRKRFSAALIDEFQDTDSLQYSIFTNIFQENNSLLYLIGDPKQAIYGFRGADIYAYLKAKKSVNKSYTLETNWRSDGGLVTAVNNLFNMQGRNPFVINGIDFIPVNHAPDREEGSIYIDGKPALPMNIAFIDQNLCTKSSGFMNKGDVEPLAAKYTAAKISELINMGSAGRAKLIITNSNSSKKRTEENIGPQHIAVLVRTNRQTSIILQELRKLSIPGVIYSAGSVYAEEEAIEIERFMRAAAEPSNENNLKTALITGFFGFDSSQIFKLTVDEQLYDSLQNEFLEYNRVWRKSGFISMFRYMIGRNGVRARVLEYAGGERKLTNYLHIAELLHIADIKLKPGIDGLINFLSKRRIAVDEEKAASDEYRLRLETDEKAVKIITVHKSKGLEFPVVFCPYLYHSRDGGSDDILKFHDSNGVQTLDIGSDDFEKNRKTMQREEFAESIRLAYVALTRARYACFTIWGRINKSENCALAWIFHGTDPINDSPNVDSAKNLDWEKMRSDVNEIAKNSNNTIGVKIISDSDIKPQPYLPPHEKRAKLSCRTFKEQEQGRIPDGWKISSFSSIFAGKDSHAPDHDQMDYASDLVKYSTVTGEPSEGLSESLFFDFPRGARAGSCIHEIMESIDFIRPNIEIAKERLEKFGFDSNHIVRVEDMLNRVLESDLMDSLSLKQIGNEQRINEMEFFLPVGNTNSSAISSIMQKYGSGTTADFASTMKSLGFSQRGGYLKGFIDMIFCHNEKFYIVDWKTNHLGNSFDDYSISLLNDEMRKSGYVLQYLLYTVALNGYLKNRVKGYSYNDHFGGVFYIFMRGVKQRSDTGLYFDCPDIELVERISAEIGINVNLNSNKNMNIDMNLPYITQQEAFND
ncbi:MAG: exodeoxyribonuclease V subunit beta [Desulfamplus sp.]|nr:exodeoxyribonuclease V subunit beta [Desulfamplus sp.]